MSVGTVAVLPTTARVVTLPLLIRRTAILALTSSARGAAQDGKSLSLTTNGLVVGPGPRLFERRNFTSLLPHVRGPVPPRSAPAAAAGSKGQRALYQLSGSRRDSSKEQRADCGRSGLPTSRISDADNLYNGKQIIRYPQPVSEKDLRAALQTAFIDAKPSPQVT